MSRRLSSSLFRAAKYARDVEALGSGNPARISRRARNRLVGRGLARAGFFRFLFR
ncbi:MAG TPA: hypothetical protein VE995_06510 [Gaiellaceae bacterium]|nr:hypothetical protein [Gaiellaceae bacterium]